MMKHNEGFTLVELMISIAIGTIVTAGVLSILLFGMRINVKTADNVKQQDAVNMLMQIVQTVAEEPNIAVQDNEIVLLQADENGNIVLNEGKPVISRTLVKRDGKSILLNDSIFMEDVSDIEVLMNDNSLLTMKIWLVGNTTDVPDYITSAYCRLAPTLDEGGPT